MRLSMLGRNRRSWLTVPVLCVGLAFVACSGGGGGAGGTTGTAQSESAGEADEMGVIAAHKQLIEAMEAGDVAAMTALMDPSANLLIFHPFIENRFEGIGEVDAGLGHMFGQLGPISWTEAHASIGIEGEVAWLAAHVLIKSPELPSPFVGRGTEIWVHRPGGWRLTHAHWSENAELAGAIRDGE